VEKLDEEPRPVWPYGYGDPPVAVHDLWQIPAERVGGQQATLVHRRRLEHDQPDAATGSRLVVRDEVVRRQVLVHQCRLMRG